MKAQSDYETEYNRLKSKIESELRKPPASNNDLNLYLYWMGVKAKDRDECEKLSYKAGKEGNPTGKGSSLTSQTRLITPAKTQNRMQCSS